MKGHLSINSISRTCGQEGLSVKTLLIVIISNDYTYGYSTFWSGNLLTELTNGAFQTRSVRGDYENQKLKIYHWLTPVQVEYREEPIICILEKKRVEDLPLPESWNMLMEDEEYMIYELPAHREVEEYLERRQL